MGTLLFGIALGALALLLPGWLAVRLLDDGDFLWRIAAGLGVGVLAMPFLTFLIAWCAGSSMSLPLLLVTSLFVSAILFGIDHRRGAR